MLVYHATQCLNYELRHQWQLSSIIEQVSAPEIICDVAVLAGDRNPNRFPSNYHLPPFMCLEYNETPRDTFAYRGLVRNEQYARAVAAGADVIFFADCDRLYHPRFFACLVREVEALPGCLDLLTSPYRGEVARFRADKLIADTKGEGPFHKRAFVRAMLLAEHWQHLARVAAGGMQIVRPEAIAVKCEGRYVNPARKYLKDNNLFTDGQKARSDMAFRDHLKTRNIGLPLCVHLGHNRDKDAGHHLEEQR